MREEETFINDITTKFLRHIGSIERLKESYNLIEKEDPNKDIGAFVAFIIDLRFRKYDAQMNENFEVLSEIEEVYNKYADNEIFAFIDKKVTIEVLDDELEIRIDSSFLRKAYSDYRDSTLDLAYDDTQFQNSLIVSLVIGLEILISEIFKNYVNSMDISEQVLKDKKLEYNLLREIGSIEEAKTFLLDQYIDGLLRNTFQAWLNELKKTISIDLSRVECISDNIKYINETIQRRHIIIHNDGQVNDLYLNKIDVSLRNNYEKGEYISSNYEYINERINTFKTFGLVLIYEYGKKKYRQNPDIFFMDFHGFLIRLLKKGSIATRYIFKEWSNNNRLSEDDRATSLVNYFLTYKLNQDNSIDDEIIDFEAEKYGEQYVLAKKILLNLDDAEDAAISFLDILDYSDFINAIGWPLFRLLEKTDKYKGFIDNKVEVLIRKETEADLIEAE